jgi:hypothetical protein
MVGPSGPLIRRSRLSLRVSVASHLDDLPDIDPTTLEERREAEVAPLGTSYAATSSTP